MHVTVSPTPPHPGTQQRWRLCIKRSTRPWPSIRTYQPGESKHKTLVHFHNSHILSQAVFKPKHARVRARTHTHPRFRWPSQKDLPAHFPPTTTKQVNYILHYAMYTILYVYIIYTSHAHVNAGSGTRPRWPRSSALFRSLRSVKTYRPGKW